MSYQVTVTEFQFFAALRAFLQGILPATVEVVKTQANRVPEVISPDFVLMTPSARDRLSMNVSYYDILGQTRTVEQSTQFGVQLDVHGPNSGDNSQVISTLFRDSYGVGEFAKNAFVIAPLYNTDPRQIPFINAENQYEDRWVIRAELQFKPRVVNVQQFANAINIGVIEVDATYPA